MANTTVSVTLAADIAKFQANMQRAGTSTQQAMTQMQRAADETKTAMKSMALSVASALTVGAYANAVKNVAEYADQMGKMSQKVGVAVEQLSGLTYAASLADVSNELLGKGLKKLSVLMQEAAAGSKESKNILSELGTKETSNTTTALAEIADRFSKLGTSAAKTALAAKGFGEKIGPELLPLLNMGAEGIRDATNEAERFGLVVGQDAADAAEKFNDNLTRLAALSKGAQTVIFGDLVIGIGNATNAFLEGAREATKFIGLIRAIETLFTGDDRHKNNVQLTEDTEQLLKAENALSSARAANRPQAQIDARQKWVDNLKARIKLTLDYKKILDEEDAKAAPKAKDGKVDKSVFNPNHGGTTKTDAQKIEEEAKRFVARLKEQAEAYGKTGAALLEYQLAQSKFPQQYKDQAMALQLVIDANKAKDEANKKSIAADIEGFKEMDDLRKADEAAQKKNEADVQGIRIGLMSPVDRESFEHKKTLEELQTFHDAKFENITLANQLIEEENARHQQTLADMQASRDMQSLAMAVSTSADLYSVMEKAGMEQSAFGKALFYANKALAVAEIIMNTNLAATKVEGQTGLFGLPMAAFVMAQGYTRAAMVAGLAISGAREKGGNVWGGGAFLVGERGPEIFQPTGHGTIIPNSQIGSASGGDLKLTIINQTSANIGKITEKTLPSGERVLIIQEAARLAVATTAGHLSDPNSQTSRAMQRNFALQRSRA